jgi:hypothetical protein
MSECRSGHKPFKNRFKMITTEISNASHIPEI